MVLKLRSPSELANVQIMQAHDERIFAKCSQYATPVTHIQNVQIHVHVRESIMSLQLPAHAAVSVWFIMTHLSSARPCRLRLDVEPRQSPPPGVRSESPAVNGEYGNDGVLGDMRRLRSSAISRSYFSRCRCSASDGRHTRA